MQRKQIDRFFLIAIFVFFLLLVVSGESGAALPRDYQEFKARYQKEGRTPEGAVKLYFEAVFCYIDESTRDEASKMLRYALHSSLPIERTNTLGTFVQRLKDPDKQHIFRSFAAGATPENNYRMSPDNFSITETRRVQESDYLKLFLKSGGADSPRPVWVKEYDGLWYTINNSSTYLGVRPPQSALDRVKNAHDADYDTAETPSSTAGAGSGSGKQSPPAEEEKEDFLFK